MSASTTASSGTADAKASRNAVSSGCSERSRAHAARRTASRSTHGSRDSPVASAGAAGRGVGLDDVLGGVVLRRVGGVGVHRDEHRRAGHPPVLRVHAVEVAADRDDEVGLVPQRTHLRHVRRQADGERVPGAQAARRIGGDQRRPEALRQGDDRVLGVDRAAARPHERAARRQLDGVAPPSGRRRATARRRARAPGRAAGRPARRRTRGPRTAASARADAVEPEPPRASPARTSPPGRRTRAATRA